MKEQAIQKINKIGKVGSIVALIARILVGIGLVCVLLGAIFCFVLPENLVKVNVKSEMGIDVNLGSLGVTIPEDGMEAAEKELLESLETDMNDVETVLTQNTVSVSGETTEYSFTMRDMAWVMIPALLTMGMLMVTLCFSGALCKAFRDCQSPFEENVIRKMQNLAIALLPWALFSSVNPSITESLRNNKVSVMLSVDIGVILVALVVLVLAYIFKYGAVLQQESDETL